MTTISGLKQPILDLLRRGVVSDDVAVVVHIDVPGPAPMTRIVICGDSYEESLAETNAGASPGEFAEFLRWASTQISAERWFAVFLGHGGNLDRFSLDLGTRSWMRIDDAAPVLASFTLVARHSGSGNSVDHCGWPGSASRHASTWRWTAAESNHAFS